MKYGKVDRNQKQIVQELRSLGFSVFSIADIGKGYPDLVIGKFGKNVLIEVKADETKTLTELEEKFFQEWQGQVNIATCTEEILKIFDEKLAA